MAILRGRPVRILERHADTGIAPTYTVQYNDGQKEFVLLSELQVSKDEHERVMKDHFDLLGNLVVIEDKTEEKPKAKK